MSGGPTDIPMDAAGVLERARQRAERLVRELADQRDALAAYAATSADPSSMADGLAALDEATAAAAALLDRVRSPAGVGPARDDGPSDAPS